MTWGVGANDLANVMSTTMGSKAITLRQALIIAVIFEYAGAFLGGVQVSDTVRSGIINTSMLSATPEILIYGMLAVLLAGTTWMLLASFLGLPVSITHTIIGAMVGFGTIVLGVNAVHWHQVGIIAVSWITSPMIAGIFAYLLFLSVQRLIFMRPHPFGYAKRYAPVYLFLIGVAISTASILRGLAALGIALTGFEKIATTLGTGLVIMLIGVALIRRLNIPEDAGRHTHFSYVEKVFAILMLFTACAMVFAHGSNDVAIAVGPMAAVVSIVQSGGQVMFGDLPYWVIFLGCTGVVLGLLMYGRNVIKTVGTKITSLTPSRAFAATLSAAFTVVVATGTGIPVSATQTLVGGVLGVGLARGIGALNLTVIRNIFMSWAITIPAGATFAVVYFEIFKALLGQ